MSEGEEYEVGAGTEADVESSAPELVVTDADGEIVASGDSAVAAASPQAAYEWQGVADYARNYGVDLQGNDAQALQTLLNTYRQSQQRNFYAEYGQRMAPYADQIQAWIQQQQQQVVATQAQAQRPAWQPPEWDPRWLQMVERDLNTGQVYSKPGVDPRIAEKVVAYADWQDKFRDNPGAMIAPLVEARAREIIQQEFASHRQTLQADALVAQNHWARMVNLTMPDARGHLHGKGIHDRVVAGHGRPTFGRWGVVLVDRFCQDSEVDWQVDAGRLVRRRDPMAEKQHQKNGIIRPSGGHLIPTGFRVPCPNRDAFGSRRPDVRRVSHRERDRSDGVSMPNFLDPREAVSWSPAGTKQTRQSPKP